MGINLITAFDYLYESVADFEESNSVKLPEDIAVMLTPPGNYHAKSRITTASG